MQTYEALALARALGLDLPGLSQRIDVPLGELKEWADGSGEDVPDAAGEVLEGLAQARFGSANVYRALYECYLKELGFTVDELNTDESAFSGRYAPLRIAVTISEDGLQLSNEAGRTSNFIGGIFDVLANMDEFVTQVQTSDRAIPRQRILRRALGPRDTRVICPIRAARGTNEP